VSEAPELPDPLPAATVVVTREAEGALEVLLLRRSEVGAFAGMWVFPGGRVDDSDAGDDELARARTAAVREALEEVGLVIDAAALRAWSHWTPPSIAPKRYATWFFLAPWAGDEPRHDDHEIVETRWVRPLDALAAELPMAPPTIVTLHELHEAGGRLHRDDPPRYVTRPGRTAEGHMVLLWHGDAAYDSGDLDAPGGRNRLWMPADEPPRYERRVAG
jgi:8-oxo-dGTP pyrophosphatase MutT (NUDIX family)